MESLKHRLKNIEQGSEAIILLHGLARTSFSMNKAGKLLAAYGYKIINVNYPSREREIESLALEYIAQALIGCDSSRIKKVHFLTHSMGGILVRYYLSAKNIDKLGQVVMLAPPSQGSEIVDRLAGWPLFYRINGPAGLQLGTDKDSLPSALGPVNFPVGIIAGDRSVNPLLSLIISGINDGKVSVNRAKVDGMRDFIVVPYSHPFIMRREHAIEQALHFIQHGCFVNGLSR